jgi:hypothetical protein
MSKIRSLILALALAAGLAPAFAQAPPAVPALPDTTRQTNYSITASTCVCSVGFQIYGDSTDYQNWVQVWLNGVQVAYNDASKGWTITSPSGSLSTIPRPITDGVLTFNSAQTGTVQIVGARRPRRTSQFQENRGVAARDLNQLNTDIIAQNREEWDFRSRVLQGVPGVSYGTLPPASACGGKYLGFDGTGQNPACLGSGGPGSGNVTGLGPTVAQSQPCYNDTTGALIGPCTDAAYTMRANGTASTAPSTSQTPSSFWDAFCSTTVGNFWVRMSSGWGCTSLGYANPAWWGADPAGAADSAPAFNSALATGKPVLFPPGRFRMLSQIVRNLPSDTACFCVSGSGTGLTTLYWPAGGGGILVNAFSAPSNNTADVKALKLTTGATGGGDGLKLVNGGNVNSPPSILRNLVIQGDDYAQGSGAAYWSNDIYIKAWEAVSIDSVQTNGFWINPLTSAQGVGVRIEGDTATSRYTQSIKITNSNFGYHAVALQLGGWWQGVLISQTNFGGAYCVYMPGSQSGTLVQLNISNSICYAAIAGIETDTNVSQAQISFNNIIQTEVAGPGGIIMGPSSQAVIQGNAVVRANTVGGDGISINSDHAIVTGNVVQGFTNGVVFGGLSSASICALNRYISTTNQCANIGTGNSIGVITQ